VSELAGEDVTRALAMGADPATRGQTLKWMWAQLLKHLGDLDVGAVDYDLVLDYIGKRRAAGAKGQTIRREVQALKRGLVMAERRGWIGRAPGHWPAIKSDAPDEKQRGKLHPIESIRLMLGELAPEVRDEVTFVALTGLRAAEVKRVRYAWAEPLPSSSPVPAVLRIPAAASKTRQERIVGLSQEALDILERRFAAKPEAELVFSQENHKKALRDACKRAGVARITLRDLRHTYATLALHRTGDAVAVQAALGHNDLRTTQRYLSSTVERTVSAGASVAAALDLAEKGSPDRGHPKRKNPGRARSSFGQNTGLLIASRGAVACECCAALCRTVHGDSHTCAAEGAPSGVTPKTVRRGGGAA
jgi:integrase